MDATQRVACPYCAEPTLPSASLCPHCRHSLLLDVVPLTPIEDGRTRYTIGRRLVELGAGMPLGELVKALEQGTPIARGLTAGQAAYIHAALASLNCPARTLPVGGGAPPAKASSRLRLVLLVLAGALLGSLLVGTLVWLVVVRASGVQRAAASVAIVPAAAPSPAARDQPPSPQQVAQRTIPSVVTLTCGGKIGTGFFIGDDALLTNDHVTCVREQLQVKTSDGRTGGAVVSARNTDLDVALLWSSVHGSPLSLASAGELVTGDTVMVVGNPLGLESTFHVGTVSNPYRFLLDLNYVQVDARINPGNSGGPLLNARGEVVGIVSLKEANGEGLGMALPIDYLYEPPLPLIVHHSQRNPGFQVMLDKARAEVERLSALGPSRVVLFSALRFGRNVHVEAIAFAGVTPTLALPLRLDGTGGDFCNMKAEVKWEKRPPAGAFRGSPNLESHLRLGEAFFAIANVPVCALRSSPRQIALLLGDPQANTRPLQ